MLTVSDATYSGKKFGVLPTGVEPMTFRTPVGRSTTELQETRGKFPLTTFKCNKLSFLILLELDLSMSENWLFTIYQKKLNPGTPDGM